jgi:hypothetical protein
LSEIFAVITQKERHNWLKMFAFVLLCGTPLIALATVITQAIKAALTNPVEASRYE